MQDRKEPNESLAKARYEVLHLYCEVLETRIKRLEIWGGIAWVMLCALMGFAGALLCRLLKLTGI